MFKFKELIELWRSDNLLTQALNDSYLMLESTSEMFKNSVNSLRRSDEGEISMDIYEQDQMVNKYEQQVRSKVLKHLVITSGANIIPSLILTSIVVDIERIGDYTKNIMDLAVAHPKRLNIGKYQNTIEKTEKGSSEIFKQIVPILEVSDKEAARRLIKEYFDLVKLCDEVISDLIKAGDPSLSCSDSVTTALYTRYLKRIVAHLMNVTSSVVNPFERIGFHQD